MYAKLFASLYQGTLRGKTHEIVVFTNILAHKDRDGFCDMHWKAIAEETGLTIDEVKTAILALEAPDPESRTQDYEGRRLLRMDEHRSWGWFVVNHAKYRDIKDEEDKREQNKAAQQRYREKNKSNQPSSTVSDRNQPSSTVIPRNAVSSPSAHTDTDADEDEEADEENIRKEGLRNPPTPLKGGVSVLGKNLFSIFWEAYPKKVSKGQAERTFAKINPDEQLVAAMVATLDQAKTSDQWRKDGGEFIPHASTWLRAKGWEDVLTVEISNQPAENKFRKSLRKCLGQADPQGHPEFVGIGSGIIDMEVSDD